jgi:hypothetical protein
MASPALLQGSSTQGSAAAQALLAMMLESDGGEQQWLLKEIAGHNVPVKRRCFPKEVTRLLRETLDDTLSLALSLHSSSLMAFSAFALFVLFPRLLLRPLLDGCQGSFAVAAFCSGVVPRPRDGLVRVVRVDKDPV